MNLYGLPLQCTSHAHFDHTAKVKPLTSYQLNKRSLLYCYSKVTIYTVWIQKYTHSLSPTEVGTKARSEYNMPWSPATITVWPFLGAKAVSLVKLREEASLQTHQRLLLLLPYSMCFPHVCVCMQYFLSSIYNCSRFSPCPLTFLKWNLKTCRQRDSVQEDLSIKHLTAILVWFLGKLVTVVLIIYGFLAKKNKNKNKKPSGLIRSIYTVCWTTTCKLSQLYGLAPFGREKVESSFSSSDVVPPPTEKEALR